MIALVAYAAVAVGTFGGPFFGLSVTRGYGQGPHGGMMGGQGQDLGAFAVMMGGQSQGHYGGIMGGMGQGSGGMQGWCAARCWDRQD